MPSRKNSNAHNIKRDLRVDTNELVQNRHSILMAEDRNENSKEEKAIKLESESAATIKDDNQYGIDVITIDVLDKLLNEIVVLDKTNPKEPNADVRKNKDGRKKEIDKSLRVYKNRRRLWKRNYNHLAWQCDIRVQGGRNRKWGIIVVGHNSKIRGEVEK